jgi:hypothetical protein
MLVRQSAPTRRASADQTGYWAIPVKPPKAGGWLAQDQKLKDAIAFFLALITDSNELVPGS